MNFSFASVTRVLMHKPRMFQHVFKLVIPRAKLGPSVGHKHPAVFPMNAVSKQLDLFMDVFKSSQLVTIGLCIDTAFPIPVLRKSIQE